MLCSQGDQTDGKFHIQFLAHKMPHHHEGAETLPTTIQHSTFLANYISHAWDKYSTALTIAVAHSEVSKNLYILLTQNSYTVFPG